MTKTWNTSPSDIKRAILYYVIIACCLHLFSALNQSFQNDENYFVSLVNPSSFIATIGISLLLVPVLWFYFNRAPKSMTLDSIKKTLVIEKKNETLNFNLDKIRYFKKTLAFFTILEIYNIIVDSEQKVTEKNATSILVANRGLSWSKATVKEIIEELKKCGVEEIKNRVSDGSGDFYVDV